MNEFVMLIGLPASGKSTWAESQKGYTVISSDSLRKELFGDESDQKHNYCIFEYMKQKVVEELFMGHSVIYDATNIQSKYRRNVLKLIPEGIKKVAILFDVPMEICMSRNSKRERIVPDVTYLNMIRKFQYPTTEEGFDKIIIKK